MDHVMKYLWSKGLVSKEQHAFIMKYSTVTNLLECTHDWGGAENAGPENAGPANGGPPMNAANC